MVSMPNIKPISDLRNYTDILKQVDVSKRVYLTRNGHGEYGMLTMDEIDELDRYRAAYQLISKLKKSEEKLYMGWIQSVFEGASYSKTTYLCEPIWII